MTPVRAWTLRPGRRTTCSATSTAGGWRRWRSPPTGRAGARSCSWPTPLRSRCAGSSRTSRRAASPEARPRNRSGRPAAAPSASTSARIGRGSPDARFTAPLDAGVQQRDERRRQVLRVEEVAHLRGRAGLGRLAAHERGRHRRREPGGMLVRPEDEEDPPPGRTLSPACCAYRARSCAARAWRRRRASRARAASSPSTQCVSSSQRTPRRCRRTPPARRRLRTPAAAAATPPPSRGSPAWSRTRRASRPRPGAGDAWGGPRRSAAPARPARAGRRRACSRTHLVAALGAAARASGGR